MTGMCEGARAVGMNIEVVEASQADQPVVRRLLEFNAYDFSEFDGRDLGPHGEYGYRYLDHYWVEGESRRALLFLVDERLAGCALIRKGSPHQVAEFFVLRKYRRHGVGSVAARKVLDLWPGEWVTHEVVGNDRAVTFWRQAIPVTFVETEDETGTTQRFTLPQELRTPEA